MTVRALAWRGVIFAAVFLAANLALDAWRAGAVTRGAISSALFTTAIATPVYLLITWFLHRGRSR